MADKTFGIPTAVAAAAFNKEQISLTSEKYYWALSVFDTSRVLTFAVSILLIVYGSFRATKGETAENDDGKQNENSLKMLSFADIHTIESSQAIALPLGASATLLAMFYFFDSLQILFTLMTAVLATVAFSFLLLPVCQYVTSPCFNASVKISLGWCGRFTSAEAISLLMSSLIVLLWIFTGHWLLMDALAMALCIAMIAFVRLPSLKVSVLLLFGLLVYDVFWVFFSEYFFNQNVMVHVATQPAYNPVIYIAGKLNLPESVRTYAPAKLSLPGKLVFPSYGKSGQFSMLGLGDVVVPGLLLCFVLRFDNHKKLSNEAPSRTSYFYCSLIGYFLGLVTATIASEVSKAAQPALLYLVPFTILPLVTKAYFKGDLKKMWVNPFPQASSELEV